MNKFFPDRLSDNIVEQIDWRGVCPLQIYFSVLGRSPERDGFGLSNPIASYSPEKQFVECLRSEEFKINSYKLLIDSLPSKDRVIFLHIPKSAGRSFYKATAERLPTLALEELTHLPTGDDLLFLRIGSFYKKCLSSKKMVIGGHISLSHIIDAGLLRFGDELLTFVRDPLERLISHVNFLIGRLFEDNNFCEFDTHLVASAIGIGTRLKFSPNPIDVLEVAKEIILHPTLIWSGGLCSMLGDGSFHFAVENLARSNLIFIRSENQNNWLAETFGVRPHVKENVSTRYIEFVHLPSWVQEYVEAMLSMDRLLYNLIIKALSAENSVSINGNNLRKFLY